MSVCTRVRTPHALSLSEGCRQFVGCRCAARSQPTATATGVPVNTRKTSHQKYTRMHIMYTIYVLDAVISTCSKCTHRCAVANVVRRRLVSRFKVHCACDVRCAGCCGQRRGESQPPHPKPRNPATKAHPARGLRQSNNEHNNSVLFKCSPKLHMYRVLTENPPDLRAPDDDDDDDAC